MSINTPFVKIRGKSENITFEDCKFEEIFEVDKN